MSYFPLIWKLLYVSVVIGCLTLKAPAKIILKMFAAFNSRLLYIFANITGQCMYRGKQSGPRSDCSYRSSLI